MGTRGFLGFVVDGDEKIGYSHYDSYPSGLGIDTLTWLREAVSDMDGLCTQAAALRVVSDDVAPTDEDVERLRPFLDAGIGGLS